MEMREFFDDSVGHVVDALRGMAAQHKLELCAIRRSLGRLVGDTATQRASFLHLEKAVRAKRLKRAVAAVTVSVTERPEYRRSIDQLVTMVQLALNNMDLGTKRGLHRLWSETIRGRSSPPPPTDGNLARWIAGELIK